MCVVTDLRAVDVRSSHQFEEEIGAASSENEIFIAKMGFSVRTGPQARRLAARTQCKYLNNLIEQDHRFIKRRVNPGLGFFSFNTAWRTIRGYEAMHMMRKGQIEGVGKGDIRGQVRFVSNLFMFAA